MKIVELIEQAKSDIASGAFGPSGSRFPDTQSLAEHYGASYVTALKLTGALKDAKLLLSIGNKNYIMTGPYSEDSELFKAVAKQGEKKIGILVPSFTNPFMAQTTEALNDVLIAHSILPVISLTRSYSDEIGGMERLAQSGCSGIFLFLKNQTAEIVDYYSRFPLPIVIIGKKPNNINVSSVTSDNYAAGMAAARHFVECGFKRFSYVTTPNNLLVHDDRREGFADGLSRLGHVLTADDVFALDHNEPKTGNAILSALERQKGRTGFFCYHDITATELFLILKNAGYSVPGDVGIIGYDNLSTNLNEIQLTTFAYSFNKMAETALEVMLEKCVSPLSPVRAAKLQTTMIVRRSTSDGKLKLTEKLCGEN